VTPIFIAILGLLFLPFTMRIALYRIKKLAGIGVALNCPIGNQYKDKKEMETQQMHLEAIKELAEKDNHWIVELVSPDAFTCKQCGHKQES
jgi:hypothetical protein